MCLLPQRYEDRTALRAIGSLAVGEKVLVEGVIELSEVAIRRRRSLLCRLADGTGAITLRFFYFNRSQQQTLARGRRVRCYGEVRSGPAGLEMVHPEHRVVGARRHRAERSSDARSIRRPKGCTSKRCAGWSSARSSRSSGEALDDYLAPELAARTLAGEPWPPLAEALRYLHSPPRDAATALLLAGVHPCSRRIALEELVAQRLEPAALGEPARAPSARGRSPPRPHGSRRFAPRCRSR